jgi:hypothetical protein
MLQEHFDKKISPVDSANYRLEGPFFKERVVPADHKFLLSLNYNKNQARNALLAEGFRDPLIKDFVSRKPIQQSPIPIQEGNIQSAEKRQKGVVGKRERPLPELSRFCANVPHKIVFEGKLFREGSVETARSEIVHGVYECAFYRGLSTCLIDVASYDYACLVAFDSSKRQTLVAAWNCLNEEVKRAFWRELRV